LAFDGSSRPSPNNDEVGFSYAGITFNGGATTFNIGGNAFSLTDNIVNNSTSLETISVGTTGITLSGGGRAIQTTTTGGITVSAAIDNGGNLLTVDAASSSTITLSGNITGAGGLTKSGDGTLTLSGDNRFAAGDVVLNAGTLNLNSQTALGIGAFTIVGGSTLDNTSGSALTLTTNNFQNWNGDFTFTGTHDLNLGTGAVTLGNTTQVTVNGGNLTVGGVIDDGSNGYGITKAGDGTLILAGANTYTGLTTINVGTLVFGANNTIGAVALNSGTLDLGSYTLILSGSNAYSQASGTTLALTITNSGFGKIVATGADASVDTGSAVSITVNGAYIAGGAQFKILDGQSSGTPGVPGTIHSNSQRVTFSVAPSDGGLMLTADRTSPYNTVGAGSNGSAAGSVLEQIGASGATGDMLTVLGILDSLSTPQLVQALNTTTPDVSSGAAEGSRVMTGNSFRMISNRLGGARNGSSSGTGVSSGDMLNGVGVWMQGLGSNITQGERGGVEGYNANLFGTTVGADKLIDKHFRAGFAGSYGFADVNSKTPGSPSDDINSYQATVYGSFDSLDLNAAREKGKNSRAAVRNQGDDFWYVDGMVSFTQNDYDSRREIWLGPATERVAKADHYGQQYSTNFEGGYTFTFQKTKALEVTPFASLGYNYLYMNSYKEKGANSLDLSVQGEGFNQLEQGLGTKLAYPVVARNMGTFIPSVKGAWLYDYIGDRFETNASFAGGGSSFQTRGARPAKSWMLFGAELAFLNKGNMTVTGNWDIELKDQFMSNTYYGTVRYDF
jgi:autotransporter-associated beta strand protein